MYYSSKVKPKSVTSSFDSSNDSISDTKESILTKPTRTSKFNNTLI